MDHGQSWNGPRLRRHSEQHDDHCLLSFNGRNWRITGMQGLHWIDLVTLEGDGVCALDLSGANLGVYTDRAAAWLEPDMLIDNAEVVK